MSKAGRPHLTAVPRSSTQPIPEQVRNLIAPYAHAAALANDRIREMLNAWFVGQGIDTQANDVAVDLGALTFSVTPKKSTPNAPLAPSEPVA